MVIKASSRTKIDALIADLDSERAVVRESAVTRLTLIGARALQRLMALAGDPLTAPSARVATLRVLEGIGHTRSLDVVLRAMDDADSVVATAAVDAARPFLRGPRGATVVDRLTTMALDRTRDETLRLAALRVLSDLEASTIQPLYAALANDQSTAIAALAADPGEREPPFANAAARVKAAADGELAQDPAALRRAITQEGKAVSLTTLHRIIERVREREGAEPHRRMDWMTARAAAHAALAGRGSRLALYDLRETLETATTPLPVEFLSALHQIGEALCLEAIAHAYAQTVDEWWRNELADVFRLIVSRERITGRHAIMKRIGKRWPAILEARAGRNV